MIALFALMSTASALSLEVGVTSSTLPLKDEDLRTWSDSKLPQLWGFRAGVGFGDSVAIVADGRFAYRGSVVSNASFPTFETAMSFDQIGLGGRFGKSFLDEVVRPYGIAEVTVLRSGLRFDDDPVDDHSPGQTLTQAFAPGFNVAAGFEVSPQRDAAGMLDPAGWLELGYGYTAPLVYNDVGTLRPGGGFVARLGFAMRFE
jgi:hypothetical protein